MIEDELFKDAQTFPMSEDATKHVLENLRRLEPKVDLTSRRNLRWIGSTLAGVAAVLIVAGMVALAKHGGVTETATHPKTVKARHHPAKPTHSTLSPSQPRIHTRDMQTYENTIGQQTPLNAWDLTGAKYVKRYANFHVKLPTTPTGYRMTIRLNEDKTGNVPGVVSFQFKGSNSNQYAVLSETPRKTNLLPLGDANVVTKKTVTFDGVRVIESFGPGTTNDFNTYMFSYGNLYYELSTPTNIAWSIINSLIKEHHYLN